MNIDQLEILKDTLDFFDKLSNDQVQVKQHYRKDGDKVIHVDAHTRTIEKGTEEYSAALKVKQLKEIEMWQRWKDSGENPIYLQDLLNSFRPMIMKKVNVYKNQVKIPPEAIELEFKIRFIQGLRSFDPSKGSLGTYVFKYIEKAKRFITEHQNVARIPENRIYKIREFKDAESDLKESLGRPPTQEELAEKLDWAEDEVDRMTSELRSDKITEGFEEDPYAFTPSQSSEVVKLFKYELEGNERLLYEHLVGLGKPTITSTAELSKIMGIPDYQVSRLKSSIEKKLREYIK